MAAAGVIIQRLISVMKVKSAGSSILLLCLFLGIKSINENLSILVCVSQKVFGMLIWPAYRLWQVLRIRLSI